MTDLPDWQAARLAELLDAFDGIPVTDDERHILVWLAGWEAHTVQMIVNLVQRARLAGAAPDDDPWHGLSGGGVRFPPW